MTPGIYEFGPRQSVMAYGGRSGNIEKRWREHRQALRTGRHYNIHLQRAWNKYGEDVFEFRVLEVIEDPDERRAAEQKWLDKRHAEGTCYNIETTAGPAGPVAEETRQKLRVASMGNQNWLGRTHTEEAKRKIGASKVGKKRLPFTEEHKRKIGISMQGRELTEEHKRNISDSLKGRAFTEEHKQRLREAAVGRKCTDESCHKRRLSMRRSWARKRAMLGLSLPVLIPNPSQPMLLYNGYRK